jgi:hypothetical protein
MPFVQCGNKLKLSFVDGDCSSKTCRWGCGVEVCMGAAWTRPEVGPSSANNVRIWIRSGSTDNIWILQVLCFIRRTEYFGLLGQFYPKDKVACIRSRKVSIYCDLASFLLQTRTARGLGIPDWYRWERSYIMINWPLLTFAICISSLLTCCAVHGAWYLTYDTDLYYWISSTTLVWFCIQKLWNRAGELNNNYLHIMF